MRMWIASHDYSKDVAVSRTAVDAIAKHYRKIRTTVRWLLGVLEDYQPRENGQSTPGLKKETLRTCFEFEKTRLLGETFALVCEQLRSRSERRFQQLSFRRGCSASRGIHFRAVFNSRGVDERFLSFSFFFVLFNSLV